MFNWLKDFLQDSFHDLIDKIKGIFDGIVQLYIDIWEWAKLTYDLYFVFLEENYEKTYEVITTSIRTTAEWTVEQVKFLGKWLWETAIYLIDCSITGFVGFFDWFLSLLPDTSIPGGFEQGVTYFIQYAMILNKILPVKEGLMMLGILFGVLVVVIVVRLILYIYRLIPFKSA